MIIKNTWWLLIALLLAVAVYFTFVSTEHTAQIILSESSLALKAETRDAVNDVRNDINKNIGLIKFLHSTPPISGITRALSNNNVDSVDNTTLNQWKSRLSVIFKALIENNSSIKQVRVVSVEDGGQEYIRVDRDGGRVVIQPSSRLQDKSAEPYYAPASKLQYGEVYVGPINLNREFGQIAYPLQPTYRISYPIFYESGERFGFIIINIDATQVLQVLHNDNSVLDSMWLLDSEGYFIYSQDSNLSFTRQLRPEANFERLYSSSSLSDHSMLSITSKERPKQDWFAYREELVVGSNTNNRMSVYGLLDKNRVTERIESRNNDVLLLVGGAFLTLILIIVVFYRSYSASLKLNKVNSIFQTIIESSTDAVICISESGRIRTWNSAASYLFNVQAHLAINRKLKTLKPFHSTPLLQNIERCKNEEATVKFQDKIDLDEKRKLHIEIIVSPVFDRSYSQIDSYVISVRDITDAVEAQERLKEYNSELEQEVEKRTAELKEHSQALEEAHAKALEVSIAKSNFISTISHEMRTPLNGMVGTLSLIRNGTLSQAQKKYLTMAENSVNTLAVLINDILDLSKIESGKLEVHSQRFSPREVIETMVQSCSVKAYEKGLDIIVDTTAIQHELIFCDPNRLKQIINNLMNNAIKFTAQGGIKVIASTEQQGEHVRLNVEVIDSGIGIAKENQHRLFQPFSQEGVETSTKYGGTGLGLSICRQLCELMNGHIDFESELGVGSRFYFCIDIDSSECEMISNHKSLEGIQVGIAVESNELTKVISKSIINAGGEPYTMSEPVSSWLTDLNSVVTERASPYYADIVSMIKQSPSSSHPPLIIELSSDSIIPPHKVSGEVSLIVVSKPVVNTDLINALIGRLEDWSDLKETSVEDILAPDLAGVHILIVDDNEINQEVARGFLEPLGAVIDTADNGKMALESIEASRINDKPYHCILMDCQMPVMNGYDCARALRFSTQYIDSADIPIIAMTANAFSGEKEKCFSYGMNDYITKPVNSQLLVNKVVHWTQNKQKTVTSEQPVLNVVEENTTVYSGWRKGAALKRMNGNEVLFKKILDMFMQSSDDYVEALGSAIQQQDASEVEHWSHKLKGLCGDIGAHDLREILSKIEQEARVDQNVNFDTIDELFADCQKEFTELKISINESELL